MADGRHKGGVGECRDFAHRGGRWGEDFVFGGEDGSAEGWTAVGVVRAWVYAAGGGMGNIEGIHLTITHRLLLLRAIRIQHLGLHLQLSHNP